MRKIIGNLVATWPGRIACAAAIALACSLAALCARPAREAEAPVQEHPAPIGDGEGGEPEPDAREPEGGAHPSGIDPVFEPPVFFQGSADKCAITDRKDLA